MPGFPLEEKVVVVRTGKVVQYMVYGKDDVFHIQRYGQLPIVLVWLDELVEMVLVAFSRYGEYVAPAHGYVEVMEQGRVVQVTRVIHIDVCEVERDTFAFWHGVQAELVFATEVPVRYKYLPDSSPEELDCYQNIECAID